MKDRSRKVLVRILVRVVFRSPAPVRLIDLFLRPVPGFRLHDSISNSGRIRRRRCKKSLQSNRPGEKKGQHSSTESLNTNKTYHSDDDRQNDQSLQFQGQQQRQDDLLQLGAG